MPPSSHARSRRLVRFAWSPRIPLAWSAALILAGTASACDAATSPLLDFPADARSWSAPAQYRFWWSLVEACSGRRGDLDRVQWYLASGQTIPFRENEYDGYWWEDGSRILLTWRSRDEGDVVRHEMLHELLQRGDHPIQYFDRACEGAVASGTNALSSALVDPTLVARAREVGPEILTISISTLPTRPKASQYDGWFVLDVEAANTTSEPLWVRLDPFFDEYEGLGFVPQGKGYAGTFDVRRERRVFFAPGQRRHHLFDLRETAADTFAVRGTLSRASSEPYTIIVDP